VTISSPLISADCNGPYCLLHCFSFFFFFFFFVSLWSGQPVLCKPLEKILSLSLISAMNLSPSIVYPPYLPAAPTSVRLFFQKLHDLCERERERDEEEYDTRTLLHDPGIYET
jgi:hypothetical protein